MDDKESPQVPEDWRSVDRKVSNVVITASILVLVLVIVAAIFSGASVMVTFGAALLSIPILGLLVAGFVAFRHYRSIGVISSRRVLRWLAIFSWPSGLAATVPLLLFEVGPTLPESMTYLGFIGLFIGLLIGMFIAALSFQGALFFIGFGVAWLFSAIGRRVIPEILAQIKRGTPETSDSFQRKSLKWMFNIPDVIDARTLTISQEGRKGGFPWQTYKKAVIWEAYFAVLIVLYLSLNPILLDSVDLDLVLSVSPYLLMIISPMIVLHWLVYETLGARVKGPVKDFRLHNGLRQRMVQTIAAFATIIVFVQLVVRDPGFPLDSWALSVSILLFIFSATALAITFVYLNYFEQVLAKDISDDFARRYPPANENAE